MHVGKKISVQINKATNGKMFYRIWCDARFVTSPSDQPIS